MGSLSDCAHKFISEGGTTVAITTYPQDLSDKLVDLSTFGIHLTNRQGVCHKCGRDTKPFSDGYSLDAMCETCSRTERKDGASYAAYSPQTVWVKKVLDQQYARERYDAIVKIDGKLCYLRPYSGSSYRVLDLETGDEVGRPSLLNSVSSHLLKQWYAQQGDATVHAHVVQLNWYSVKENVASELHYHVNWAGGSIPIYDLGHSGRGWEKDVPRFVRLYLRLRQPDLVNRDDFELLDVQLVKDADAPFLDGYEVAKFPDKVINLKWSQAGPIILKMLSGIKTDFEVEPEAYFGLFRRRDDDGRTTMQRAIDSVREHYEALKRRYAMPTDAWITLIVSNDRYHEPKQGIAHELDHIIVHTNE